MGLNAQYTQAPVIGDATTGGTGDTGYGGTGGTAPTTAVTVLAGSTNGTKVDEVVVEPVGTVTAGVVNLFLFDGTTYWLFDQFVYAAQAVSQTAGQFRFDRQYPNLILPNGWSLRATQTVTGVGFTITALGSTF